MTTTRTTPADTVRAVFSAIDASDFDSVAALLADDVHFRFGNFDPTETKAGFATFAQGMQSAIRSIRHEIHHLWEVEPGTVVAAMDVHYQRADGQSVTLPCCNVFRVRDGLVHDYRIYMDVNPVLAP